MKKLPIYEVLPQIQSTLLNHNQLILQAPPGAGKSTVVPILLLDEPWLEDKMIIMLEPRRVAARMVATQMAKTLGEEVGQTVGYQIKMESCFSKKTKVLVVTEAILVRKLQSDQELSDVALVIFDEFHERSIHTDLSLALSLQVQELLRDDLKLLIMSATLHQEKLLKTLGEVPVITSHGRTFPITYHYLKENEKHPSIKEIVPKTVSLIKEAIKKEQGDILVFLSGQKSIRQTAEALNSLEEVDVLPLYSNLSKKEQDRALLPSVNRRVILSTNIAQTSVTIEGVRVVIDTGLEKASFYNENNGMIYLKEQFISKQSAIQRAGRAGRLNQGVCYRFWHEKRLLQEESEPEILRSDLSEVLLQLSQWGAKGFDELIWLDTPSRGKIDKSWELLKELHMINDNLGITSFGESALRLGMHPRLGFMVLKANALGFAKEASILASLLSEKDIFANSIDSNLYHRFSAVYENDTTSVNIHRFKEAKRQAEFFYKRLTSVVEIKKSSTKVNSEIVATLLLFAYPDRLAILRKANEYSYKLSNGKGALLVKEDRLFNTPFLVVANLHAKEQNSFIGSAIPIELETIKAYFSEDITIKEEVHYDKSNNRLNIKEKFYFHECELESKPCENIKDRDMKFLLLNLVKCEGLELLTWSKKANQLKERVSFISLYDDAFQSFDDEYLLSSLDQWLEPFLNDIKSVKELEKLDTYTMLLSLLPWEAQQHLESLAPTHIKVPSGSKIVIDYSNSKMPVLAVKLQEVFGLMETPKIYEGKVSLQMQLLSPAQRPIQITYDLKSFWENSYDEVRKELRGKYKKHYWPQNPYEAQATNKTNKQLNR